MTTPAQRAAQEIAKVRNDFEGRGETIAAFSEIIQREFQQQTDALAAAKDALMVATTPLPEDRQKVLAALAKINAL